MVGEQVDAADLPADADLTPDADGVWQHADLLLGHLAAAAAGDAVEDETVGDGDWIVSNLPSILVSPCLGTEVQVSI